MYMFLEGGGSVEDKGFRTDLKHQTKGFCNIKMSAAFLPADVQPVRGSRRQCRVQAASRLREGGEGERGKEEEKEGRSKEKVGLF